MQDINIEDYKIVSEHDISKVEATVRQMLNDNWKPWNNLIINTPVLKDAGVAPLYTQVMVKYSATN